MANVIIDDTNLTNIANAIRGKNGTQTTYLPSEMATAITNIPSGGSAKHPWADDILDGKVNTLNLTGDTIKASSSFDIKIDNTLGSYNGGLVYIWYSIASNSNVGDSIFDHIGYRTYQATGTQRIYGIGSKYIGTKLNDSTKPSAFASSVGESVMEFNTATDNNVTPTDYLPYDIVQGFNTTVTVTDKDGIILAVVPAISSLVYVLNNNLIDTSNGMLVFGNWIGVSTTSVTGTSLVTLT